MWKRIVVVVAVAMVTVWLFTWPVSGDNGSHCGSAFIENPLRQAEEVTDFTRLDCRFVRADRRTWGSGAAGLTAVVAIAWRRRNDQ